MKVDLKRLYGLQHAIREGWRVQIDTQETLAIVELAIAACEQRDLLRLSGATVDEVTDQQHRLLSSSRAKGPTGRGKT